MSTDRPVPLAVIILAAGHGTRMQSKKPKILHEIGSRSMLEHVISRAQSMEAARLAVVVGVHAQEEITACATGLAPTMQTFIQPSAQGTGDAVRCAMPLLEGFNGDVVVLYADTPLIEHNTLLAMRQKIRAGAGVVVLGFRPDEPGGYGRLLTDATGDLVRIVEAGEAGAQERAISLCNSGVMAFTADILRSELPNITNENTKREYYLTDMVAQAHAVETTCAIVEAPAEEVLGVNSRVELAHAEGIFQQRCRRDVMLAGATLLDPFTTYFSWDTKIGQDVTIGQNVFFGPGVRVHDGAVIKANCHIEGATIAQNAVIGPYARLRPGAKIGDAARIGNFVEIKNACIGANVRINHLSYIGDADVGCDTNIGAGTITCNYDGYRKFHTRIGQGVFIGSHSALVAPVHIGDNAYIGSGSVITQDVAAEALGVARAHQVQKPGWTIRFRARQSGLNNDS